MSKGYTKDFQYFRLSWSLLSARNNNGMTPTYITPELIETNT